MPGAVGLPWMTAAANLWMGSCPQRLGGYCGRRVAASDDSCRVATSVRPQHSANGRVPRSSDAARTPPGRAVVDSAERLARSGTWEWDLESDELMWSENMYRL